MATQTPSLVRRTFRITVDVETTVTAQPRETLGHGPEEERSHQALVQLLLAHPPVLSQLLRSSAVEALLPAKKLLEAEYGWGRISEQQVLQPLVAELEPAAQAYFTEELEDGVTVYSFDGYAATIKQVRMTEVGQEGEEGLQTMPVTGSIWGNATEGVNRRCGPGTGFKIIDTLSANQDVTVVCFLRGDTESFTASDGNTYTSDAWDFVVTGDGDRGGYVADVLINTGGDITQQLGAHGNCSIIRRDQGEPDFANPCNLNPPPA